MPSPRTPCLSCRMPDVTMSDCSENARETAKGAEKWKPLSPPGSDAESGGAPATRRRAVALRYDPSAAAAPRVVASGSGLVAEQILELARQHGVPVKDDPQLVQALMKLDIGEMIPPQLYLVVAEVFAWLHRVDQEAARR